MAAGTECAALVGSVDNPTTAKVVISSRMRRVSALVSSTTVLLPGPRLPEHDGSMAVEQHAMLEMPAHRPGQGDALEVAAYRGERRRIMCMADALDFLLDDGALVEVGRHVVRGRSDQLHTMHVGLLVGPAAAEAR